MDAFGTVLIAVGLALIGLVAVFAVLVELCGDPPEDEP